MNFNDKRAKALLKQSKPGRFAAGNGLYFRVSAELNGFWEVRYTIHGKRRQMSLGRYPDVSLADANLEAAKIKKGVTNKVDPLAERQRAESSTFNTVDDLAEDWLTECDKRLKHPNIPRRVYRKDLAPTLGRLGIGQITPRDIRGTINKITESNRPTVANDALMYCKQLFRHGIKLDLLTTNPADAFNVNDAGGVEKSRSRALSIEELEEVFVCFRANRDQFTRENFLAVALLLSLGIRKGELIGAQWEEFDLEKALWDIPKERSKTGREITVPLPDITINWLKELQIRACESDYVFPRRRASKRNPHISPDTINAAIAKLFREDRLKIAHFTVHDLRRTCRSLLASKGIPGHVAERCLNHAIPGVAGIYDRYDYLDERREALNVIAELLAPIINPARK